MENKIDRFYSQLAEHYHLIFEDWNQSIERQAAVLNPLIASEMGDGPLKILDCACGIGTQALGFAANAHQVVASDLNPAAVARASIEANHRGRRITFYVSDMTKLAEIQESGFDAVAALDNALPHLTADEVFSTLAAIHAKIRPGGLFIASIRDYDSLLPQRPTIPPPAFFGGQGDRRIVHQVWDWIDDRRYTLHLYITQQAGAHWDSHHFVSEYRCLLRDELSAALQASGFENVRWLMPAETRFYQPLLLARRL